MTYEVWVMVLLLLNTALGVIAVWQRHSTIKRLRGDQTPSAPSSGLDVVTINEFFKGLEAIDEAGKSSRQDEGPSKGWDYPRY